MCSIFRSFYDAFIFTPRALDGEKNDESNKRRMHSEEYEDFKKKDHHNINLQDEMEMLIDSYHKNVTNYILI